METDLDKNYLKGILPAYRVRKYRVVFTPLVILRIYIDSPLFNYA